MKRKSILALIGCLVLSSSLLAGSSKSKKRGFDKFASKLNLSEAQLEKLKAHKEESLVKKKALRDREHSLKDEMKKGFSDNISDEKLRVIHQEMSDVKAQKADLKFEKMIFMKSILTQEQREQFSKLKSKHRKRDKKCDKNKEHHLDN